MLEPQPHYIICLIDVRQPHTGMQDSLEQAAPVLFYPSLHEYGRKAFEVCYYPNICDDRRKNYRSGFASSGRTPIRPWHMGQPLARSRVRV